jgi:hypothetical protein
MGKDLAKGKSFVTVTGKVKITERSFSGEKRSDSGYVYNRVNLGIETAEGNVVYGEMMGGYSSSKPVIYAMNKEDNSALQVNFADRLNDAVIDSVADFKIHKVGIERNEKGELMINRFLSPMDIHDYLQEKLVDGTEITVRGSFKLSEYKDETQRKLEIQHIFLPYQAKEKDENGKDTGNLLPVEYRAGFVQTVLLTEDSFKKITKADAEAGEVIVQAQAVDYVGKKDGKDVKKNMPFPLPITVKINKEKPELTEKILNALFKVKKNKVRELTIEGNIIEGYDKEEVSGKDIQLSAEIQELIEMGLYTEEEASKKMTVRGNKVSKLVFTRPFIKKTDDNPNGVIEKDDEKYSTDDLFVQIPDASLETNALDGVNDEGSSTSSEEDENAWMSALGV